MERAALVNKKALPMLLKLVSPRSLNTGLARSLHRDTEREIKVLWVLRGSVARRRYLYRCAIRVPSVTYGTGRAP